MKKTLATILKVTALAGIAFTAMSCGSTKRLYYWSSYQESYYRSIRKDDAKLLQTIYKRMVEKPAGLRGVVPPGIYAEYGWLLIQTGDIEKGTEMLKKEIELYPESEVFIRSVLKEYEK